MAQLTFHIHGVYSPLPRMVSVSLTDPLCRVDYSDDASHVLIVLFFDCVKLHSSSISCALYEIDFSSDDSVVDSVLRFGVLHSVPRGVG